MPDWLLYGIAAGIALAGLAAVGIEFGGRRPATVPAPGAALVLPAAVEPPPVEWVDTEALIRDLLLTPPTLPDLAGEVLHVRTHRDPLPLPAGPGPRHLRLPQIVDEITDPSLDVDAPTIWFNPAGDGLRGTAAVTS